MNWKIRSLSCSVPIAARVSIALVASIAAAACSSSNGNNRSASPADSAGGSVATGNPPTRAARLSAVDGDVTLQAPGSTTWSKPTANYTVAPGDRLATGSSGRAEMDLGTGAVRLDNGSDATVTSLADNYTQLGLDQGALDASLYQYDPADSIEIDTPNGAFVPTQAGSYYVSYDPSTSSTLVDVVEGALALAAPGLSQVLNAGQMYRLLGNNPVQLVPATQPIPAFSNLDRWRAERDARWARRGPVTQYVSESVPGWEDLDDNGQWTVDQTNTPVWCPTKASSTYVPYRQGHWSWVEPWGWTWVDDAPWGYTTSHYGRWEQVTTSSCNNANRWAWVPAPTVAQPVYAPALVAFVDAARLAAAANTPPAEGWFPLGPQEIYVPPYPHSDDYLRAVNATNLREVRDVAPLLERNGPPNGQWRNRNAALTIVPATAFSAGEPVRSHIIAAAPAGIVGAPVGWRPNIRPQPQLLAGGSPAPPPHIQPAPRAFFTRAGHGRGNGVNRPPQQASGEVALPPVANPHAVSPHVAAPQVMPPRAVAPRPAPPRAAPPRVVPQRVTPPRPQPRSEPQRVQPRAPQPQVTRPQRAPQPAAAPQPANNGRGAPPPPHPAGRGNGRGAGGPPAPQGNDQRNDKGRGRGQGG